MARKRPATGRPPKSRTAARRTGRARRRRVPARRRWLKAAAKWAATAAVWVLAAVGALAAWYATDLPDIGAALDATRRPSVTLIAADGSTIASFGDLYGPPARLEDLPPALPAAVMAIEDRRFHDHFGIDIIGLARALVANLRAGRIVQGGSTITQQVAKNLFLTPDRTIKRKVQELMLALWLENRFTKDQILTVYLNRVYLGAGTYGVEAASRRYFGRPARDLTLYQSAMLAGLLKAPSRYNPINSPDLAAARTAQVLSSMVAAGYLTAERAQEAKSRPPTVAAADGRRRGRYFADWVLDQIPGYVTPGDRDLVVVTTLDTRLQGLAESAVAGLLSGPGAGAGVAEAALLAMSPDGAVRVMVGGRDHATSQFNRATQARRQPGSAFKPIVYLAALEAGMTPETQIMDAPVTVEGWTPRNFTRRHRGRVTLGEGLAHSINTVAVRVAEMVGRDRVIAVARRLGITSPLDPRPSLALGAAEVSLAELTAAYGTFANGGFGLWAYGIEEIRDAAGVVLYRRAGSGPGRVAAPAHVAAMNRMLSAAVSSGTGRAAALDRPVAGKTGTSQDFRDAWFIGYSAHLVAGVWMGNDDGRPMKGVTGGGLPARLWRDFMAAAHRGVPPRPLPGLDLPAPADQREVAQAGKGAHYTNGHSY